MANFMVTLCGWRWFYQEQKRIWTTGTDLCLLNSVLRCLELYEIYLVVWHGVLLVFFFTMRDFWIASENHFTHKKIYPFDLCFLVPTAHVILIKVYLLVISFIYVKALFFLSWIKSRLTFFIIHQIFSLARDWSKRVTWANYSPAKTGEYPRIFPNF